MAAGNGAGNKGGNGGNGKSRLRFGIIGCGAIGPTHAGAIKQLPEDAELVAVADLVAERAAAAAKKFSVPKVYKEAGELICDPAIDVVCVCTPSGMHAEMAVAAMEAGKHVIVEKPMDVSLAACDRMIAAEKKTRRVLTVISQHRFDAASMLARHVIDSGEIGRIVLAEADVKWWRTQQYYDSGDWRGTWKWDGGGAMMNQGVHTVDLLQWLAGGVATVFAHTLRGAHERIEVEDIAVAALKFRNGAIGSLTATTGAYDGYPVRIEIFGTEGSILLEGDAVKQIVLKNGKTYDKRDAVAHAVSVAKGGTASVKNQELDRPQVALGDVWGDAHRAQIADFIDAVRNHRKPLIDGRAAREPVQIILAAYESSRTGKVVELR